MRHAETVWNAHGRIQGQADPPLSDRGWQQVAAVAGRLQPVALSRVVTSDLARARNTAEAIVERHPELTVEVDPRWREVDLGAWEGATRDELARDWPELYAKWRQRASWDLVPGGEGTDTFAARVRSAVTAALEAQPQDAVVLVVTHIGVIRLILSLALGTFHDELRWPWAIHNTGLTLLELSAGAELGARDVEVLAVNDSAHLAAEVPA